MNELIKKQKRKSMIIIILFVILLFAVIFAFFGKNILAADSSTLCTPYIYDFYKSSGCIHCDNMKQTIANLQSQLNINSIDILTSSGLSDAQTYGVTDLPAFVIGYQISGAGFKETGRIVGETSSDNLIESYNQAIAIMHDDSRCIQTPINSNPKFDLELNGCTSAKARGNIYIQNGKSVSSTIVLSASSGVSLINADGGAISDAEITLKPGQKVPVTIEVTIPDKPGVYSFTVQGWYKNEPSVITTWTIKVTATTCTKPNQVGTSKDYIGASCDSNGNVVQDRGSCSAVIQQCTHKFTVVDSCSDNKIYESGCSCKATQDGAMCTNSNNQACTKVSNTGMFSIIDTISEGANPAVQTGASCVDKRTAQTCTKDIDCGNNGFGKRWCVGNDIVKQIFQCSDGYCVSNAEIIDEQCGVNDGIHDDTNLPVCVNLPNDAAPTDAKCAPASGNDECKGVKDGSMYCGTKIKQGNTDVYNHVCVGGKCVACPILLPLAEGACVYCKLSNNKLDWFLNSQGISCKTPNGLDGFCNKGVCSEKTCQNLGMPVTCGGSNSVGLQCCEAGEQCCPQNNGQVCCKKGEACRSSSKGYYCDPTDDSCSALGKTLCPSGGSDWSSCCDPGTCVTVSNWGATMGYCGQKDPCTLPEEQCGKTNGGSYCCKHEDCTISFGFPYCLPECTSKQTAGWGIGKFEDKKVCCTNGVSTPGTYPNGFPRCINVAKPQGNPSSQSSNSIYMVRDSNSYSLNGIAYVITPHLNFNKNVTVTLDYSIYNYSNPETYKYEDEDDIFNLCNSSLIGITSKDISVNGDFINFGNDIRMDIPNGALDNYTNFSITKYNLYNCDGLGDEGSNYYIPPECSNETDCPDTNNSCTYNMCVNATCIETNLPDGTSCPLSSGLSSLSPFMSFLKLFGVTLATNSGNGVCSNGDCVAKCVPKTCSQLGLKCGNSNDSCGGQINCGTCPSGQSCNSNGQCITPISLVTSSAPASAALGSTLQIKCDFGAQLGCITAFDGGVGCSFAGFSTSSNKIGSIATVAVFNCKASKTGMQDNYCDLFNWNGDSRCVAQQNKIQSTNVVSSCATSCSGKTCGDNGCGGSCGTCSSGQSCTNGQCVSSCVPKTCSQLGLQCGTIDNGCGTQINCGTCSSGQSCTNGQCVNSNVNPVTSTVILKSSSAPASAALGSTFQMKCDFGVANFGCVSASHGGVGCSFAGFSGTAALFNCVAKTLGMQDNYCNLFNWNGDSRCVAQQNKIQSTNVVTVILKSSSAPASAALGSTFQMKCDFGVANFGCVSASHGGVGCSFAGFSGTAALFNCVAKTLGMQDNYCNLFNWNGDSRCVAQQNKIQSTNVG